MIKNEWKSLWNNKILIIVVMAIIVIPVIYAGLFLKSMWDPYGNLDKLPLNKIATRWPAKAMAQFFFTL